MTTPPRVRIERSAAGAETIHVENRLKARLERVSGLTLDEMTRRAAQGVARAAGELAPALDGHVRELERLCDGASAPQAERLRSLRHHARELRSLGETLGFPLLTAAGTSLYAMLEALMSPAHAGGVSPPQEAAIALHARHMRRILSERMTGPGGEAGRKLLAELQAAVARTAG